MTGGLACPSSLEKPPSLQEDDEVPLMEDDRVLGFNILTPLFLAKGSSSRSRGSPGSGRSVWERGVLGF